MQKLGRPQNLILAKKHNFGCLQKIIPAFFLFFLHFGTNIEHLNLPLHFSFKCSFNSGNSEMRLTAKFNKNKIQNLIPEKHTFWVSELRNLIPTKISTVKVVTNSFFFSFSIDHIESFVLYYFVFLILKQILFCDR